MKPSSYGGKAGVWLKRRRGRKFFSSSLSSSSSSHSLVRRPTVPTCTTADTNQRGTDINHNTDSAAYGAGGTSSLLSPLPSPSKLKSKSKSVVTASTRRTLSRTKRSTLFVLRGSHFGGILPKKYIALQQQQQRQQQKQKQHQMQNVADSTTNLISTIRDNNRDLTHEHQSQLSFENSYDSYNDNNNHHHQRQSHSNYNRYTHSPIQSPKQGQVIGWDSVKCRPIYFQQLQNGYDLNGNGNDSDSFDNQNNDDDDNNDDYDDLDTERMVNEDEHDRDRDIVEQEQEDEVEEEDPEQMWKDILEEMNHKKRKANRAGGSYSSRIVSRNRSRGLSNMPLSVLERIVSPSQNRCTQKQKQKQEQHQQHQLLVQQKIKRRKLSSYSRTATPSKIKTIGRLNKNTKKRSPRIRLRKIDRQKVQSESTPEDMNLNLNLITNEDIHEQQHQRQRRHQHTTKSKTSKFVATLAPLPLPSTSPSHSPFSLSQTSNNNLSEEPSMSMSLLTPVVDDTKRSRTICTLLDSNRSKSSSTQLSSSSSSLKGTNNVTLKENMASYSFISSSPPPQCELDFPDDDLQEEDNNNDDSIARRKSRVRFSGHNSETNIKNATTRKINNNNDQSRQQPQSLLSPRPRYQMNRHMNTVHKTKDKSNQENYVHQEGKKQQTGINNLSKKNEIGIDGMIGGASVSPIQISSNTPLAVAKAFFDRLDKFELTQTTVLSSSSSSSDVHPSTSTAAGTNTITTSMSFMTPTFNRPSRNICALGSSVSKASIGVNTNTSSSTNIEQTKSSLTQAILSSSPTELEFSSFIDDDGEVEKKPRVCVMDITKGKKVAYKKAQTKSVLPPQAHSSSLEKKNTLLVGRTKQKRKKNQITHAVKVKKKINGLYSRNKYGVKIKSNNDANVKVGKINQISSNSSLSAAKAFFERLDRYELTIA